MKTNWSTPKTNILAGMNDLRKCLASGHKARLIRARNEDCEYPILIKNVNSDFRSYTFSIGYASSINKIKADPNLSEFEKHLTLNYVSVFGSQEAKDRYYETGICTVDNFKNMGCSHLVHVDDMIKFLEDTKDPRAALYKRQYRANEQVNDEQHFFDFYRCDKGSPHTVKKFKRKLWVVDMLNKDMPATRTPILVHILNVLAYPLKYIPNKSVLRMKEYKCVTFRIGAVTNGFSIEFHIPKKFSFK